MVVELQDYGWGDMYYGMLAHASGGEYIWVDAGGLPKESRENRGIGIVLTSAMVGSIVNESLVRYYALRTLTPGGASVETRVGVNSRTPKPPRQLSLTTLPTPTTSAGAGAGSGVGATFHGVDYRFVAASFGGEAAVHHSGLQIPHVPLLPCPLLLLLTPSQN